MINYGDNIPFRIVAAPEALVGSSVSQIARRGFWRLTYTVEGETSAIAFSYRPHCVLGPPVHVITGIVSAAGTIATTNSPVNLSGVEQLPLGTRVIFRATPDATGRALYDQMAAWQTIPASLFWDDDIETGQGVQRPEDQGSAP